MKILFALLLTTTLHAQTLHMAVLGGGGEPHKNYKGEPNESTIFDDSLEALGIYSGNTHVKSTLAFNGGHKETEALAEEYFGTKKTFNPQEFFRIIDDYKKKIQSGEIKRGDQILINLISHGAEKAPKELTHQIAANGVVTDFNQMAGTTTVSVDSLKSLVDLATSRGIRMGIIDYSCHSGNTLALANANTCVISSTGSNHFAGAGTLSFGTLIAKAFQKGKSLEDVYLEARNGFTDVSFPMISSPAGLEVQQKLYEPLTPYLYYHNPSSDKFIPFMEKKVAAGEDSCNLDDGFQSIMREVQKVTQFDIDQETRKTLSEFQKAVGEYKTFLDQVKADMEKHGLGEIGKKHKFCSGKECINYTTKEIALGDYDRMIKYYESQGPRFKDYLNITRQVKAMQERIMQESPGAKTSAQFWRNFPELQRRTSILQGNVARHQRALYNIMYKNSLAEGPNPCRDFKL